MGGSSSSFDAQWNAGRNQRYKDIEKCNNDQGYGGATIRQSGINSSKIIVTGTPNELQKQRLKDMGFEYSRSEHGVQIYKGPNYLGNN